MNSGSGILLLFPILIMLMVVFRLIAGQMNHGRIRDYIRSRGGEVKEITWNPFGPGWLVEKNDAIYQVRYEDGDGNEHDAHCKTSMLSGVYLTNDQVVGPVSRHSRNNDAENQDIRNNEIRENLEEENRKLREEIRQLKRRNTDD